MNWLGWLGTFVMSAVTGLALAMDASMQEFSSARVAVVLLVVALVHVVRFARVVVHAGSHDLFLLSCLYANRVIWTMTIACSHSTRSFRRPAS